MGLKPRRASQSNLKTRPTATSVEAFVAAVPDPQRRRESEQLLALMRELSGEPPVMWGSSIVGFGRYHYRYATGREGDWPRTGFSPRKRAMTVYCMPGFSEQTDLLGRLGPHTLGTSCLYLRALGDVDLGVLRAIVERSLEQMRARYPE